MAIYHLHAKMIQRSKGKNVVAAAAYRHAAKMHAESEGLYFDYTNKTDVAHCEILIPKDSPQWLKSLMPTEQKSVNQASEDLWNLVESIEKRKDAQLAREIEFSLPIELSQEQNIQLAREFIHDQFVLRGMVADFSVHYDEANPHVHVLLSTREITQEGFGQKVVAWNNKVLLCEWREKWAEYENFHLRMHGHNIRVDHRSYKDQGIDLVPGVHQGKAVSDMERRGLKTDIMSEANWVRRENLARICANPEVLLHKMNSQSDSFTLQDIGQELGRYINDQGNFSMAEKGILAEVTLADLASKIHEADKLDPAIIAKILNAVEHHESVFTDKDLAKAIAPHTDNAELFAQAVVQIKTSDALIRLGPGDDGRDRFTTRRMFEIENTIQKYADVLRDSRHLKISSKQIDATLTRYQSEIGKQLTSEQMIAVKHMLKPAAISCVVGRAGTGKSFSLGAARAVWESQGLKVMGVALSGIAADGLSKDARIESRTIESFRYAIQNKTIELTKKSVVVMDEAGMTDSHSMLFVLNAVQDAGAKIVLVGDHAQIQPVGPGASFRALLERLGFAEINTVYRQKEQWQRDATVALSAGKVSDALAAYSDKGCVHLNLTADEAINNLTKDWLDARNADLKSLDQYLVVAHRNDDVNQLNQHLRSERVQRGEIAEGYSVDAKNGALKIAEGDRVLFLKNDKKLGVSNGRFATIQSVLFTESGRATGFVVVLDGSGKEVHIEPNKYNHFALGYAATVHKVQGMTVDHSFVYAGGRGWNRHLSYVAMSRHRDSCHIYGDLETHKEEKLFAKNLGRLGLKDSLLDYPLAFAERRGIDTSGLLKLLPKQLAYRLAMFTEKLADRYAQHVDPERYYQRKEEQTQRIINAKERSITRENARLVAAYVDSHQDVGRAWQSMQTTLEKLGLDKIPYGKESFKLIEQTREYQSLEAASKQRNALASEIMKAPDLYQKAIALYGLDLEKLRTQAERYQAPNKFDLSNALKTYVDMEVKQTALVNEMHSAKMKGAYAAKEASVNTIAHGKEMAVWATEMLKNLHIARKIESFKGIKPETIAQRGSFSAIQARFAKGEFDAKDIHAVLTQIRNKALSQARAQERDRSRGRSV